MGTVMGGPATATEQVMNLLSTLSDPDKLQKQLQDIDARTKAAKDAEIRAEGIQKSAQDAEASVSKRLADLIKREEALKTAEATFASQSEARSAELNQRDRDLVQRASIFDEKQRDLLMREKSLADKDGSVSAREAAVVANEKAAEKARADAERKLKILTDAIEAAKG